MRGRNIIGMRLRLAGGGTRLIVRSGARTVAAVDLRTYRAVAVPAKRRAVAAKNANGVHRNRQLGASALAIAAAVALLVAACPAAAVRLRGRMQHNPAHDGRS
jgi:hypothetical protein